MTLTPSAKLTPARLRLLEWLEKQPDGHGRLCDMSHFTASHTAWKCWYEGRLVDWDTALHRPSSPSHFKPITITDAGRAALAAHRSKRNLPAV